MTIRSLYPALLSSVLAACDASSSAIKEPDAGSTSSSSGAVPAGTDAGPDCVENPRTHLEILNACTTAQKITKNPTLPRLLPDGGLPPLE